MDSQLDKHLDDLDGLVGVAANHLDGDLDHEQIELYDLAFSQAEILASRALRARAREDKSVADIADYFTAESLFSINGRLSARPAAYGLTRAQIPTPAVLEPHLAVDSITALGRRFIEQGIPDERFDEEKRIMRDTFRQFADDVVAPRAEAIHRNDSLVPEEILQPLREMGCFGLSVPERYGGLKPDNYEDSLGMVVVTEELSRGSLGAAGSLITRPEIMARAILEGGSEAQKQRWLPGIASGERLCAISVTEPNTGSDVAAVALRATRTQGGWLLNGGKTWCTFAGAADSILVLARSDADASPPHRGLSLFVVDKPPHAGHDFHVKQDGGGELTGRAIATIGYRGMHSYEMFYDDFFVPSADLIGEDAGEGRGFYYTMSGFMGGRLQTAARACGLMRAAFEAAVSYASARTVFGRPVAQYPLSLAKIAKMGANITACKEFTYQVARLMDNQAGQTEASLVKLLACRAAEWVTREALQLHGGMGYAEESPVSRYFVDARVLSIFEGAEETLAVRVAGKALTT